MQTISYNLLVQIIFLHNFNRNKLMILYSTTKYLLLGWSGWQDSNYLKHATKCVLIAEKVV